MTQFLATQAAEIVFEKEVELPRKFRLVKSETTRYRLRLVSAFSRVLNLRDQGDCPLLVLVTLLGLFFINLKQLAVAEVLLHDDPRVAVNRVDLRNRNIAVKKQPR